MFSIIDVKREPTTEELAIMLSSQERDSSVLSFQRPLQVTEVITVPTCEHVAQIVGKNGYKIKNLRAATKTCIKTPLYGDDPVFIVTGTQQNVRKAGEAIRRAAHHFDDLMINKSNICAIGEISIKVAVPYKYIGAVVGRNGQMIVSIKEQTNTRINTPKCGTNLPVFEVMGTPANVEAAKNAIMERVNCAMASNLANTSDNIPDQSSLLPTASPSHRFHNLFGQLF